jgi:predicted Zn-dependent protease
VSGLVRKAVSPLPPPLWGRAGEGGGATRRQMTPTPNPSPQGGGERTCSGGRFAPLRALGATFVLLLAGCSSLPGERTVSLPEPPKQTDTATAAQREHQRILATYGGAYKDARLEETTTRVVERLVAASARPDLHYQVTILNSSAINAFALPNGQIYITRGLIALANDNAELASVLSHEMSHVIANHAALREDRVRLAELKSRVATEVFNDPQVSAMTAAKSKLTIAGFSRIQEFEADSMGVGISARAGFDPYGAVRFLTAMGRNAALRTASANGMDPRMLDFLSSHPATPERVKAAQVSARQYVAPGAGERERGAYLAAVDGLAFGEDPTDGFVRGRRFLHPKLGFTFTAPEGFSLDNTAQAVLGVKDGGGQALRLDVVRVPAEQSLTDYLTSGWIESVDKGSVEELTIGGFPAATATAKGDQWEFRLYAVRFGTDVYRFIFAVKSRSAESDRLFRDSVNTFRRMTLSEADAAKPLRLKVVTVAAGDTADHMAQRMATDRPLERFLLLNGLEAGQALKAGDRVKVVVE